MNLAFPVPNCFSSCCCAFSPSSLHMSSILTYEEANIAWSLTQKTLFAYSDILRVVIAWDPRDLVYAMFIVMRIKTWPHTHVFLGPPLLRSPILCGSKGGVGNDWFITLCLYPTHIKRLFNMFGVLISKPKWTKIEARKRYNTGKDLRYPDSANNWIRPTLEFLGLHIFLSGLTFTSFDSKSPEDKIQKK